MARTSPRIPAREIPRWSRAGHVPAARPAPARPSPQGEAGAGSNHARFRNRHLALPLWWLGVLLASGAVAHGEHAIVGGAVTGLLLGLAITGLVARHMDAASRLIAAVAAAMSLLIVPLVAWLGFPRPLVITILAAWALCSLAWTVRHRPRVTEQAPPEATGDEATWDRLAARMKWHGHLTGISRLPGGGRQYDIVLDGVENHIGTIVAANRNIAAAFGKAQTEAYAEPAPDGVESRGRLTLLGRNTLAEVREWNGRGADPDTGLAVVGRFADGSDAHVRFYGRRDGIRHGLIAGTTGAGKTYTLDLLIRAALGAGTIVPVILDPQEGQSLPQWREHLLYAAGPDECLAMMHGLRDAMLARSRAFASAEWTDEDGDRRRGLDFYDPEVSGRPAILIIGDEFPVLLGMKGALDLAKDIAKLGRKTGVALWPVAQVPSLEELGSQVVRSMLAGGNVICLRTGDRVSASMIGLEADPSQLPRYFRDRTETYGLGYVIGPDQRQAPARVDMVPTALRKVFPAAPPLDAMSEEAIMRGVRAYRDAQEKAQAAGVQSGAEPTDEAVAAAVHALTVTLARAGTLDRGELTGTLLSAGTPGGILAVHRAMTRMAEQGTLTVAGDNVVLTGHPGNNAGGTTAGAA